MKELGFKKLKKEIKKSIPWMHSFSDDNPEFLFEFRPGPNITYSQQEGNRCSLCKGSKLLCGKTTCPVLSRAFTFNKINLDLSNDQVSGSSPPSVFVGRIGYPYVYVGPMSPTFHGDTAIYDQSEAWFDFEIDKIIKYRSSLIRGMFRAKVTELNNNKLLEETQNLTMSQKPAETEMALTRTPRLHLQIGDNISPMGPSGPLSKLSVDVGKTNHTLEKAFYDTDLLAKDATLTLYESGRVAQSSITRAFSVGMFGEKKARRLVPTRWSITAVDSMLGIHYRNTHVHTAPWINKVRIYEGNHFPVIEHNADGSYSGKLGNRFIILMIPGNWSYELIEAFFPGASWNPNGSTIGIASDWEPFKGRTRYARIGGCYYTARLRIAEYLAQEDRQATVIVLREEYPTMTMPVGVWLVRETVRKALSEPYIEFETLSEALRHIDSRTKIPLKTWLSTSDLLQREKTLGHQSCLDKWISKRN